jgi:hypothetical protein
VRCTGRSSRGLRLFGAALAGQDLAMTCRDIAAWPGATELSLGDWCVRSFDVRRRRAVVIVCVAGTLLVTLEGDPLDHLLSPGESLTAHRRGRVVVAGIGPSAVRLQAVPR